MFVAKTALNADTRGTLSVACIFIIASPLATDLVPVVLCGLSPCPKSLMLCYNYPAGVHLNCFRTLENTGVNVLAAFMGLARFAEMVGFAPVRTSTMRVIDDYALGKWAV